MEHFKDSTGKISMMRKLTWFIVLTVLLWGTMELVANIWFNALDKDFEIHGNFILGAMSIAILGKVSQKGFESYKNKINEREEL